MAITYTDDVNFGKSKNNLLLATAQAYYNNGDEAGDPISIGDGLRNGGTGTYIGEFSLPDGFTNGFIEWDPGDGSGALSSRVFIPAQAILDMAGMGSYPVVITLNRQGGGTVGGAIVTVWNNGITGPAIAHNYTNSSGEVQFNLDAGTYKVIVSSVPGYAPLATQTLVVDGPEAVAYTIIPQSITPPLITGLCVVQFWVRVNGSPLKGAQIHAALIAQNQAVNNVVLSLQIDGAVTNDLGYAELQLVRLDQFVKGDGKYRITIRDREDGKIMSQKDATIPNASVTNYEDMI